MAASDSAAGLLLITGSVVFLVGAAVGVPRVFGQRDPEVRLRLLTERAASWRLAQPPYALGPLVAAAGVGVLAGGASGRTAQALLAAACGALLVGALAWCWSVYRRATRVREFAFGTLPGWPFAAYVLLTIGGLALLGAGLLAGGYPSWAGWLTLGAAAVFLAGYLGSGDLPPFAFYLVLLADGVALL